MPSVSCLCVWYHTGYTIPTSIAHLIPSLPSLLNLVISTLENSQAVCDASDTTNCQDSSQCLATAVSNNNGSICCAGYHGCYTASGIAANGQQDNVTVRCDAHNSCGLSYHLQTQTTGTGDVFSTGEYSAYTVNAPGISTNGNIFCSGLLSCTNTIMQGSKNVYCMGYGSCYLGIVINIDNVFGYAHYALFQATINSAGNVYCDGWLACHTITIRQASGNIYGNGHRTFEDATIENIAGYVTGVGMGVLKGATVDNATHVS